MIKCLLSIVEKYYEENIKDLDLLMPTEDEIKEAILELHGFDLSAIFMY